MSRYIKENKNSFTVIKNSKNYGNFKTMGDAKFIRDILIDNNWNLNLINEIYKNDDEYLIVKVIDEKVHIISKYLKKPSQKTIEKQTKKYITNPNASKYGLNITKIFDTFIIKKQIAGDDYIFGYYDNLDNAKFVRDFLFNHNWNIGEFSKIEFDEDAKIYKIVEVIDDKVYVIDDVKSKKDIDLNKSYEKFLLKIVKHKYGLSNYPYLDELVDKIDFLKNLFNVEIKDDNWDLNNVINPLYDSIFNLTPWQKIIYDVIDDGVSFEDIKKSLLRYKSKNFEVKLNNHLTELINLNLISKDQDGKFYKLDK